MPVIDLGNVIGPTGATGSRGATGPTGATGADGPNTISTSTNTNINGVLSGNGSKIRVLASDTEPVANSNNLLRSGAVFDALSSIPNQNMIENWYFYGGGSQSGRGSPPINSRGLTSYASSGWTIDGWRANGNITVSVAGTRLVLSAVGGTGYLRYYIRERPSGYVTFSAIVRGTGGGYVGLQGYQGGEIQSLDASARTTFTNVGDSYTLVTGTYNATITDEVRVFVLCVTQDTSYDVMAVKLERGSRQTLAHLSGNKWVINDNADYDTILLNTRLASGTVGSQSGSEPFASHYIATAEMLGPVEDGLKPSARIESGKLFVHNGFLYRSTTAITTSQAFAEGTNCVKTTLAELLNM